MNSDVQHRLSNYSETPPPSAWEGIRAALDETPAFAEKLHRYEQTPPPAIWEKVAQQLTPATKVVQLRTTIFKYAIAAAVLLAIATGSLFFLKHSNGLDLAQQPQQNFGSDSNKSTGSDSQLRSGTATTAWEKDQNATGTTNDVYASNTVSTAAMVHFSPSIEIPKTLTDPVREITIVPEEKNSINTELPNRYMIATTTTGAAVRLPKKAYSDYACADAYTNLQCKEKIESIQSKMAASVATDFTDFIDLLKKLQDN